MVRPCPFGPSNGLEKTSQEVRRTKKTYSLLAQVIYEEFEISRLAKIPREWFPSDQTRDRTSHNKVLTVLSFAV